MHRWINKAKKNQKGFTLVELMVVVVIIGILVAIAIPIYSTVTANAEGRACQANQRIVDGAISMWYAEDTANSGAPAMADLVGTYLAEEPFCPEDGDAYVPAALDAGNLTPCPNLIAGHAR